MWKKIKPYVISIAAALLTGALSAFLTRGNMDIYERINVPPLSPPQWLFPVVWSILYILMGIGSACVYLKGKDGDTSAKDALSIYFIQLAVNFCWSIIFFNMEAFLLSFLWLLLLWLLVFIMMRRFYRICPIAGWLQVPYLLWIKFAGYLNLMIWILNR